MSTWFTSDLHLGHYAAATEFRRDMAQGDPSYHDFVITENINSVVSKKDKLYILGDVAFTTQGLNNARLIQCNNIELILGNHDTFALHKYLDLGWKIHGFRQYRKMWLSHCPIHPVEMYRCLGNIHGHVHRTGITFGAIEDPRYFNVNTDVNGYMPVPLEKIEAYFAKQ